MRNYTLILSFILGISFFKIEAQETYSLTINASVAEGIQSKFKSKGRLFVFISDKYRGTTIVSYWPQDGLSVFAKNIDDWSPDQTITFNGDNR